MVNLHGTDYTHCMYIVQRREVECGLGWAGAGKAGEVEARKPSQPGLVIYSTYSTYSTNLLGMILY